MQLKHHHANFYLFRKEKITVTWTLLCTFKHCFERNEMIVKKKRKSHYISIFKSVSTVLVKTKRL